MRNKRSRHPPRSDDKWVDWEFYRIIYIIENILRFIRAKKILRDPDNRRKTIYGLLMNDKEVWLSLAGKKKGGKHYPAARILLHEVLHVLYQAVIPHSTIYSKENILWRRLTDEQKRFLRRYVPRRTVKTEPRK